MKTSYTVQFDEARPKGEQWVIVETSTYGDSVLYTHATMEGAISALRCLKKSAVPRLSLLFPFGGRRDN